MNENSATKPKPSQKFPRNSPAVLDGIEGTVVYVNDKDGMIRLEKGHWKAKVHYSTLRTPNEEYDAIMYEVR